MAKRFETAKTQSGHWPSTQRSVPEPTPEVQEMIDICDFAVGLLVPPVLAAKFPGL
jgi:hypothetical protein